MRATVVAGLAAGATPMLLGGLCIYSSFGGPSVSGGEALGGTTLLALGFFAVLFVITAYPLIAWLLHRRGALTRRHFYRWLFVSLAVTSLLLACILASLGFGSYGLMFAPGIFALMALLALPFRPLWFKFAS